MLTVNDLTSRYGGITAIRGISMSVPKGSITAVIGRNGAGKTTLLKSICGLIKTAGGEILFEGRPITGLPAYKVARMGLVLVPEGRQILAPLTVAENLDLGRQALGGRASRGSDELERVYALFPILRERHNQAGGSLSGGQQQMLAIGRALMGKPRMLLLDEPSLGLAPLVTSQVFEALVQLNREGLTVVLVEQNARRALDVTENAYVIEQGKVVQSGASREMAQDQMIVAHYLGTASTKQL
ncbi:branched-chain amino acid transport system ATP-binding protein [Rhodoligotrophos appendicifer]|uniref:ABC transporter ATP-binding protein n=1 Tax=Rhodoligotrophos appendicifer TaxID=987056 RepID=UPI00118726B8|nr:ABC transporter ATP-binding protein [Rhodoligotrophos appendicifer]